MNKEFLRGLMLQAWQMVKRNGYTMGEAMSCAWRNAKLKVAMALRIVKFYFQKVDGSMREAYGTLKSELVPAIAGEDNRRKNDTVQVYFDTEKQEWRCFKRANLIKVVL